MPGNFWDKSIINLFIKKLILNYCQIIIKKWVTIVFRTLQLNMGVRDRLETRFSYLNYRLCVYPEKATTYQN